MQIIFYLFLKGVVDLNKLKSVFGDHEANSARYAIDLDPIPEASAPPYEENPDSSHYEAASAPSASQSPAVLRRDNPYKTHGKLIKKGATNVL